MAVRRTGQVQRAVEPHAPQARHVQQHGHVAREAGYAARRRAQRQVGELGRRAKDANVARNLDTAAEPDLGELAALREGRASERAGGRRWWRC